MYNKNGNIGASVPDNKQLSRLLRIKVLFLLAAIGLSGSVAAQTSSPNARISLDLQNVPLKEVFARIEDQSNYIFVYYDSILDASRRVSISVSDQPVGNVLEVLFAGTENTWKLSGRQIVIGKAAAAGKAEKQTPLRVMGSVKDTNGEPLIGVTVFVKERPSVGTATDINGNYLIDVQTDDVLEFSYVGYKTQDVAVAGRGLLDIVLEQNDGVLLDAIRRELSRGGQVYYLHNRVESIERCAGMWQQRLPDARIGIVHGKMGQKEIAKVMNEMADGAIDILVCTTIIETGIDIPNVNTLIIEDADRLGLAQLHQIRGRSSRHAYAYLCYRHGKALSEIAQKRLSAIREYAAFGSGFKIAMRDLEIRGAGNVLGPEQSGHMMSVGYDLYLKLLEEAVQEEKGETPKPRVDCAAELLLSANLPSDYVPDAGQRIDLYRRIALIRTEEQRSDMLDELIDRFGEPPEEAVALLDIALLRSQASEKGIAEIKQQDGRLLLTFAETDFVRLSALCGDAAFKGRLLLNAGSSPYLSLRLEKTEKAMDMARLLVARYGAAAG